MTRRTCLFICLENNYYTNVFLNLLRNSKFIRSKHQGMEEAFGDTITSHTTGSDAFWDTYAHGTKLYPIATQTNDSHDEIETECERIPITTDNEGNIIQTNQVHNYLYRDEMLSDVCFYDFVRCFSDREEEKTLRTLLNLCRDSFCCIPTS